jgi:hypothetical protein
MPPHCSWLFGRGASIANGLPWLVPDEWKGDLLEGRISREAHISMIVDAIQREMNAPTVHCDPYQRLIETMAERTADQGTHRLMTTNWDYLLQRALDTWMETHQPGWAPRFLSTQGMVYHFNGSAEPGDFQNRSPIMLETDSASARHRTYEANQAYKLLLWSSLIVIVGMSFECNTDRGLLAALRLNEDNTPIGAATFIIVDSCQSTLERTYAKLAACFPRAGGLRVSAGFAEWIEAGMPELVGRIFRSE